MINKSSQGMRADKLLSLLRNVKRAGKGRWTACCPAHDDRHPSLSIKELDYGNGSQMILGGVAREIFWGPSGSHSTICIPNVRPITEGQEFGGRSIPWTCCVALRSKHLWYAPPPHDSPKDRYFPKLIGNVCYLLLRAFKRPWRCAMDDDTPSIERGAEALDSIAKEKLTPEQQRYIEQGRGIEASGKARLKVTRASNVKRLLIDWLLRSKNALGKPTLIAGDPGLGKSLVTVDMATRVSTGSDWPASGGKCPLGDGMVSGEDDPARHHSASPRSSRS